MTSFSFREVAGKPSWKPSLFLTAVFSLFGLVNADSCEIFAAFVLFGGALDFLKSWIAHRYPMSPAESARDPGIWFILIQLGFTGASFLAFVLVRQILNAPPELAEAVGTRAYEFASPWIRLLRVQYNELAAHGYDARAGEIALYYPILFTLFYLSLALQSVQYHRYFRARQSSFKPIVHLLTVLRKRPVLMTFCYAVLSSASVFLFYKMTFAGIEWHERGGKWRWDLYRSDAVLINYVVFLPCVAGVIALFQLCFRRRHLDT